MASPNSPIDIAKMYEALSPAGQAVMRQKAIHLMQFASGPSLTAPSAPRPPKRTLENPGSSFNSGSRKVQVSKINF
jgi:hypothetical protein